MIRLLIAVTMLAVAAVAAANPYPARVLRVIDGDTIEIEARYLPVELRQRLSVRLAGIDTPESGHRARCPYEANLAAQASAHVRAMIANARTIELDILGWDKYGGRIRGRMRADGQDISASLIAAGFARPYTGSQRLSWCPIPV
jgi:micrococcal nuclease